MNEVKIKQMLQAFLIEDAEHGDVTTEAIFHPEEQCTAEIVAKGSGKIAGMGLLRLGFEIIDRNVLVDGLVQDGQFVEKGNKIARIQGSVRSILFGERVLLNLLQRLSGIATMTDQAIQTLNDDTIRICDTRKTTPGLRMLEKYAVRCGGGYNHRYSLSDAVLIKDNHIMSAGSITKAVKMVKKELGHMVTIQVETTSKEEVLEAVEAKVHAIMFDNCSPELVHSLQALVPSSVTTEASGGINLESLPSYRGCGVDYISLGFITHSTTVLDLSLKVRGDIQ
ncbi:carboxylating nicotinate-nucleotide diphosphorylase [Halalkalibacterium ligniniphilum]|uniref:carboxylating nicotinate-nucleotide diphosphorylase n=1 Tax=Halalkalibacterium ligniniphilum TaxID=1134413 RepID=UPI000349263B|nr:carboxylating nicotinate-nucleotide diphosphorylase [Halalkalibacterium ligniniphilum]